jgi:membrane protease YdiL (CAAX protease family)
MLTLFLRRNVKTLFITTGLEPISFWQSILIFAIPGIIFFFAFYVVMPTLTKRGVKSFFAYSISLGIPAFGMFVAAIIAYVQEGNPLDWNSVLVRFNYHAMSGKEWLWTLGALIIIFVGFGFGSQFSKRLIAKGVLKLPKSLPAWIDPTKTSLKTLEQSAGGLQGNWSAFFVFLLVFIFNVLGEELLWRGIVLPRQMIAMGTIAWLAHAVLWALFHFFKWWELIGLLFVALPLTFIAYYLDNNTPALILHAMLNVSTLIVILQGVLKKDPVRVEEE